MGFLSGLLSFGRRLIPGISKVFTRGVGLVKRVLPKIGRISRKVADVAEKVGVGIQVAKQLPVIGEKVKEAEEKLKLEEKVQKVGETAQKVGRFTRMASSQVESKFPTQIVNV